MNLALKIYQQYGQMLYGIIKENPYKLADDIQGVGFKMADEIAQRVGILMDSDFRIRSGIFYCLLQSVANGHTYLPQRELLKSASELLRVEPQIMEKHLMDLQMEKKSWSGWERRKERKGRIYRRHWRRGKCLPIAIYMRPSITIWS